MENMRLATIADRKLLYEWANDSEVRANSFASQEISYETHMEWFHKKLNDKQSDIYIYEIDGVPVGQVRLEYKEKDTIISYSIQRDYRNQGYGFNMLKWIEANSILERPGTTLIGYVKYSNTGSIRVFEKLGYMKKELEDYIEYKREI